MTHDEKLDKILYGLLSRISTKIRNNAASRKEAICFHFFFMRFPSFHLFFISNNGSAAHASSSSTSMTVSIGSGKTGLAPSDTKTSSG